MQITEVGLNLWRVTPFTAACDTHLLGALWSPWHASGLGFTGFSSCSVKPLKCETAAPRQSAGRGGPGCTSHVQAQTQETKFTSSQTDGRTDEVGLKTLSNAWAPTRLRHRIQSPDSARLTERSFHTNTSLSSSAKHAALSHLIKHLWSRLLYLIHMSGPLITRASGLKIAFQWPILWCAALP